MPDLIAGDITCMFGVLITSIPQMRAGRVRAIAVTSARRSPYVPEVPTMDESGVRGYAEAGSDLWFGIVGPAGIPKPIVHKLNETLIEALRPGDAPADHTGIRPVDEHARGIHPRLKRTTKWGKIIAPPRQNRLMAALRSPEGVPVPTNLFEGIPPTAACWLRTPALRPPAAAFHGAGRDGWRRS
jgi:hypothetical protein